MAMQRSTILLKLNTVGGGFSQANIDAWRDKVGRYPDIVMFYQNWTEPLFYSDQLALATNINAIPESVWTPGGQGDSSASYPLTSIAAGSYDSSIIIPAAQVCTTYNKPIIVRMMHECNLSGSPWAINYSHASNTAADYISAWQHIVTVFRAHGATKVQWAWTPNVWGTSSGTVDPTSAYPGDDYVDYIGLDGYNSMFATSGKIPQSPANLFGSSYDSLVAAAPNKPFTIGETSSTPDLTHGGVAKSEYFGRYFSQDFIYRMPKTTIVGIFDRNKEEDWRIDSSADVLASFKHAVNSIPFVEGVSGTTHRRRTRTAFPGRAG